VLPAFDLKKNRHQCGQRCNAQLGLGLFLLLTSNQTQSLPAFLIITSAITASGFALHGANRLFHGEVSECVVCFFHFLFSTICSGSRSGAALALMPGTGTWPSVTNVRRPRRSELFYNGSCVFIFFPLFFLKYRYNHNQPNSQHTWIA
jgi:hypothetical protein